MQMRLKATLVIIAAILFAMGPVLVPDFGGFDPNLYPNPQVDPPVQPAGYAFAIWGVIYIWLLIHAGFGLFKRADVADWNHTRVPLFISLAVGAMWLPVAMISALWAFVLIVVMLIFAASAFLRAPARDRWLASAPLALYASWLTAASFASVGLVGAGYGILFGPVVWAHISIAGALVTTLLIHAARPDEWVYFTAVIWALVAIAVKNGGEVWLVTGVAALGAVVLTALMVRSVFRHRFGESVPRGVPHAPDGMNKG